MKTAFVAVFFLFLGFALFYGWNQLNKVQEQNKILKQAVTKLSGTPPVSPTTTISTSAGTTTPPSGTQAPVLKAAVQGTLSYPGEGIPPLRIFAVNVNDKTKFFYTDTPQNQSTFTINNIEPGIYYFFAYPQNSNSLVGGYSKAVPCGLSVNCTDHSLIPVTLSAGQTSTEAQVKDWYAPDGTFPAKPN